MLIDDLSKGASLSRLVGDRAFVDVVGCPSAVLLDTGSIPDAFFVVDMAAKFIAGQDLKKVNSDGMQVLTPFAWDLIRSLNSGYGDLAVALSGGRVHPYIEAFLAMQKIWNSSEISNGYSGCHVWGDVIWRLENLRAEIEQNFGIEKLRSKARGYERSVRKAVADYRAYVESMFELHPDARVAVVEIRYKFSASGGRIDTGDISLAKEDLSDFLKDMSRFFENDEVYGCIWKLEFALYNRFYSRVYVFFSPGVAEELEDFLRWCEERKETSSDKRFPYILHYGFTCGESGLVSEGRLGDEAILALKDEISLVVKSDVLLRADVGYRARTVGRSIFK